MDIASASNSMMIYPSPFLGPKKNHLIYSQFRESDERFINRPHHNGRQSEVHCNTRPRVDTGVTSASAVILYPGVYWLTGTDHIMLGETANWKYFTLEAYVKGHVESQPTAAEVKATGHGVISGEQYVWFADRSSRHQTNTTADSSALRIWR